MNSRLAKYIGKVRRWMHSDQRQRWVAKDLMAIERMDSDVRNLRRTDNYRKLPLLRDAMVQRIAGRKT